MNKSAQKDAALSASIIPLQRTLVRRVLQVFSAIMLLWFGVYLGLNDRNLGRLVTYVASGQVRGRFILGYAHYDYWSSLGSLILNTAAPVAGGEFELRDPNGDLVLGVKRIEANMYIGELIRGLIRTAVSAPFGRGSFIEIHASEGRLRGGTANIHPISLPRPKGTVVPPPDVPYTEVNILAAMSGKKPRTEDAPPSPGHVRIVIDGPGVTVEDLTYEMAFAGWHGRIERIHGAVTLRMSTDSSENRPGLMSFYYEVAPLTAERGTLVLGTPEGAGEFVFPLRNIALRRFGARASRRQDLVFRGQAEVAGATVELDGGLLDTYCDAGVKLQLSFEHGGGLALLVPGKMLKSSGNPRGRAQFFGPFSSTLPQTPQGRPAPCLGEAWHHSPFSSDPEKRNVSIEGQVAGVEAEVATIAISEASSPFSLLLGELTLPKVVGSALGGEVRAEPLRIGLSGEMPWSARVFVSGTDPAQVALVPKSLGPYVTGKLRGGFRLLGHLAKNAHPERIAIERVEATLERLARRDPLPREVKLSGNFTFTPDQLGWHNLHLTGETLALDAERGHVAIESGRLDVPAMELHGKGPAVSRIVQSLGVNASIEAASMHMRIGGSLRRPELYSGGLALTGMDFAGRRFVEGSTDFTLRDGTLAVAKLLARGPLGTVQGNGSIRLFLKNLQDRPTDPAISLGATVEKLNLEAWNKQLPLGGLLSGQINLLGTLHKPLGTLVANVPLLQIEAGQFRDVAVGVELAPEFIALRSLQAALGTGLLNLNGFLHRDAEHGVDLTIRPQRLPLSELPAIGQLPFQVAGTLSGLLHVLGMTTPLHPRLDGQLHLDGLTISGRPSIRPALTVSTVSGPAEPEPLFTLLGMAVRVLTLNQGELSFKERADGGTQVRGALFGAFELDGLLYLEAVHPRGEINIRFGCPASATEPERSLACDLMVSKLIPDLRTFGDVSVATSGVLTLRFGPDPRGLFFAAGNARGGCPVLASRPLGAQHAVLEDSGLALAATLRLGHALLDIHAVNEDGDDERYRVYNDGDVLLCSDGRSIEMGRVQFLSQRQSKSHNNGALSKGAAGALSGSGSGRLVLSGLYSPADSNLHLVGQLRLELLEDLLRGTFRHIHGEAQVDAFLRGKSEDLKLAGRAELREGRLVPHAIETPIEVTSGVLEMEPNRVKLHNLRAIVDGAATTVDGNVEVQNWQQIQLGHIDFKLSGDISARLLQWSFAHNIAEASGNLGLRTLHITGTISNPEVEGTLIAKDLFLNLRRFHELLFNRGTVTFARARSGSGGRIVVGCPNGPAADCQPLVGAVDSDGKVQINGRIEHSGLGDFIKPNWYRALDNVRAAVVLENVRHTASGVYNVEVTTPEPGLQLIGNRDQMRLLGNVEVVSGRYMQNFELTERFLSARRVLEEEAPFWEGDPFLSSLLMGLSVRTRGTFRVYNNIADLRLSTSDFALTGPLENVAMGGIIRVESGTFYIPGLRNEFEVRGDSRIDFSTVARWPETPWVDVRGSARELDQNDQQRNLELALRGKVKELRVECVSSESMSASDCASLLLLGDSSSDVRRGSATNLAGSTRPLQFGDPAAKLLSSQLFTNQVTDPLREKLRLDSVRFQIGVSSFDLQLCKHFGLYLRMCGLAEWGVFGNAGNRYRGYGELQLSDWTVGQVSFERIERGLSFLEDTINRFKVQAGLRLPLHY